MAMHCAVERRTRDGFRELVGGPFEASSVEEAQGKAVEIFKEYAPQAGYLLCDGNIVSLPHTA